MNTKTLRANHAPHRNCLLQTFRRLPALAALFWAASIWAAQPQLIWDPLGNGGTTSGSGNWDTTAGNNVWTNPAVIAPDVAWTQTSTTFGLNGATFNGPDAAASTYVVSLDAGQIAVTNNLIINNSGYLFSGANAIFICNTNFLSVAAGKTVTFNCNMGGGGNSPFWTLGAGATMMLGGNLTSGQQLRMAGAAGSVFNLTGTANAPAILFILGQVNLMNGTINPSSTFDIGYPNPNPINGTAYTNGTLTVSGTSSVTINGNILIIGRSSGNGTLALQSGTVTQGNTTASRNLAIDYDGSANSSGTVIVSGGTLNVGSSSQLANEIAFFQSGASTASATGTLIQSGGTINTWGGITFGLGGGTGAASLTQSGGTVYVGANGITKGGSYTGPFSITLAGGTVGALANWSSSLPMALPGTNGNTTFQCADGNGTSWNLSLSGALTGAGGVYVTGGGTLTLSGANNYAGNTVVSNGTLSIVTGVTPAVNGPVTVDGSSGSPTLAVTVSNPGQYWTNNGSLTFQNGNTTLSNQFGALSPSATVAPIQVNGNVAFTATPTVNIGGAAIAAGTYPLIKYTGTVSGTVPTSANVTLSSGSASGYVTNFTASNTIALVVTSSTYTPALYWAVGNGVWDINATPNWKGNSTKYTDGSAVVFDDSASGASPITVTLNTVVNPLSVTANNSAKNYTIAGTGSISGSGSVTLLGSGTMTLACTNAYTGGTVISAGKVNINNGGTATSSAIGTGTLTINAGATLDNTSGSSVTLQASIPESWNGNFTYAGSSTNFNTGAGSVTMNGNTTITVNSNNFTVGGSISDNGNNYTLTKNGSGALTLPVPNNFGSSAGGGLTLSAGLLDLGDPGAVGQGVFTINGGTIDNVTGAPLQLSSASSYKWGGSFSFLGSTNLDFNFPAITIPNGLGSITLNIVTNTLTTGGAILNNNTTVIKTGNGTWQMNGSSASESLGLTVSAGQVNLDKSGQAITGGNSVGMTVQAGGLVQDQNSFQVSSGGPTPLPIVLSGGIWDLNGFNENVDKLSLSGGGTLRNGAPSSTSTLHTISGYTALLSGPNCQFDVEAVDGTLNFNGALGGSGSLVKIGAGLLNLESNNVYTGSTTISNGTIALLGVSSISNTAAIYLSAANSILDMSGNTDTNGNPTPVLALQNGQTLSGFGVVTGLVTTVSGATLAPGSATSVGTLTVTGVSGTNTLNGTTMMKLNKGALTNDQLVVSGSLAYGGTLVLTNLSGSLTNGDSFTLFKATGGYSGAFASITPSRPGFPGFGLAWNTNNLAANGTISVITASVPPSPKITGISLSGVTLSISGTNGPANEPFVLMETTNLAVAPANWVPILTNSFDGSGNFNVSVGVTNNPAEFFSLFVQ